MFTNGDVLEVAKGEQSGFGKSKRGTHADDETQ